MQTTLSEYQKQLLKQIAEGERVSVIARRQKANVNTVRTQIYEAIKRLGARTTAHAIAIAIRNELI